MKYVVNVQDGRCKKVASKMPVLLIVDGYNIINNWSELSALKEESFDASRFKLIENLMTQTPLLWDKIIIVFDAYRVKGHRGTRESLGSLDIVYTEEGETADNFIERLIQSLLLEYEVEVASSDALEQSIILGKGARRISARELKECLDSQEKQLRKDFLEAKVIDTHNLLEQNLDHKTKKAFEKWRRA